MMQKKFFVYSLAISMALLSHPAGNIQAATPDYSQVASEEDKASAILPVGKYGMLPIYPVDIKEGTYPIQVQSSSAMFRVVRAELTVSDGSMTAAITLSGTGYGKLFPGTAKEAAAAEEADYVGYEVEKDGKYTYTLPVEALDKELSFAAFSTRKEKWYDRTLLFDASTLPEDALLLELPDYDAIAAAMEAWEQADSESSIQNQDEASQSPEAAPVEPMTIDLEDGEYSIEVALMGGSGKASVLSPTLLTVSDGKAYTTLEWSSSNYDYMLVGNEKYLNTNTEEGNSTFEIPIAVMDEEMAVIADTTAMGTPHEVNYSLTFYSESIGAKSQMPREAAKRVVVIAAFIIIGGGILNHILNRRKRSC